MKFETLTVVSYAHLASAIFNGDESGLEASDLDDLRAFYDYIAPGEAVDVAEEAFFGRPEHGGLPGEVVEYTILYREGLGR